ncbi:MAG: hypothetical protein M3R00_04240 [Pseudomonadota bacterium]|nr:hypothetical protein [Pseudomonadota bacterium]
MGRTGKVRRAFEFIVSTIVGGVEGWDDTGTVRHTIDTTDLYLKQNGIEANLLANPIGIIPALSTRGTGIITMAAANVVTQIEAIKKEDELFDKLEAERKAHIMKLFSIEDNDQYLEVYKSITVKHLVESITSSTDTETLWADVNTTYLKFILARYRQNRDKLSAYDAQRLQSVLVSITHDNQAVAKAYNDFVQAKDEAIMAKEAALLTEVEKAIANRSVKTKKSSSAARTAWKVLVKRPLEFIINVSTGLGVSGGLFGLSLGLLAFLIPGLNVATFGVFLGMAIFGGVYSIAKHLKTRVVDKSRKARMNDNAETVLQHGRANQLSELYDHACLLNSNPENQPRFEPDNVVGEINNNAITSRGVRSKIGAVTYPIMKCVGIGAVGVVIGWFAVTGVEALVMGFGAQTAFASGLLGVSFAVSVAVPAVFAVLVAAFLIIKTAHSIYKSHQEEKKLQAEVDRKIQAQTERAKHDQKLADVLALSELDLLKKFIAEFMSNVATIPVGAPLEKAKNDFIAYIESVIGFTRNDAKTEDRFSHYTENYFYSYLATKLRKDLGPNASKDAQRVEDEAAIALATSVKKTMNPPEGKKKTGLLPILAGAFGSRPREITICGKNETVGGIFNSKIEKPWNKRMIQRNVEGNLDHWNNLVRIKNKTVSAISASCPIGIGLLIAGIMVGVGVIAGTGGIAFPVIAAALGAALLTTFILCKVSEHKRSKRLQIEEQNVAKLEMQTKTVEYIKANEAVNVKKLSVEHNAQDEENDKRPEKINVDVFAAEESLAAAADQSSVKEIEAAPKQTGAPDCVLTLKTAQYPNRFFAKSIDCKLQAGLVNQENLDSVIEHSEKVAAAA